MLDANRLLHAILDQMLQLLPSDPAAVKRLDDMIEGRMPEAALADGEVSELHEQEVHESVVPSSGVVARPGAPGKLQAAS